MGVMVREEEVESRLDWDILLVCGWVVGIESESGGGGGG